MKRREGNFFQKGCLSVAYVLASCFIGVSFSGGERKGAHFFKGEFIRPSVKV